MDLDKNVEWAKGAYDKIRSEPRYMAARYYEILVQLDFERQALMRKVESLQKAIEKANGAPFDPFPIRYSFEDEK